MKEDVLPEGWEIKRFEGVIDIQGGSQPPKSEFIYEEQENYIRLLQIRDFGEKPLPTFVPKNRVSKFCQETDILIARYGASLGRIVTGLSGAYNVALAKTIYDKSVLNDRFVFYLLQTPIFQKPLSMISRSAQNGFAKQDIADIKIPLPPLPEQQYLSQKLTELLDEVAQTKQRLEAIPVQLKQFRQSVLADAVSGRLTGFRKYQVYKLKDYFNFIDGDRGSNYPKKDEYLDKGYCLFLSTKNVREFGFDFSECVYISQEKDSVLRKGKLSRGDIIITTRGTLGNVASYDENISFDNVRINSGMLILRKKENNILNEYSKILIASPLFKKMIIDKQTGSAQPQLPAGILKEFEVPIPSIEEQTQIVQKVETYFALADEIEIQVNVALENVNLLTQSILAKAFSGELSATWRKKSSTYLNKE
ncbi:MAG: restriction endonuclease subunit S [Haemophilus parainfluenzae]|jgi:restriction modification system DNA specificity domain protein|nr:restriction endonuclease subunit S [Haemophilus parainfluenzae]